MFRIKTLNKISPAGLSVLDQTRYSISGDVENEDGILVRSADMHAYQFPDSLRAVARAGAGTNNIPIDRCSESGIVVFNTPGANANAVKELVVCALLLGLVYSLANLGLWWVYLLTNFSPVNLWLSINGWFTELGQLGTIPWQETAGLGFNLLAGSGLSLLALKHFGRKDVA